MLMAQPGGGDGRVIGAAGGGGAFFGDDLGISGARQVRADAPQILVHARYPLFAAEFAVLVGQGNHGGYFAAPEAERIAADFAIADINLVKPGIGEATRVLLRRLPWKLLVHSCADEARLGHLYQLAKEKGVEIVEYPLENYLACGLIRSLADN